MKIQNNTLFKNRERVEPLRTSNYHYSFNVGQNLISFPFVKALDWETNVNSRYTPAELFGDNQIITEIIGPALLATWTSTGFWTGNLSHIDPRISYYVRNVSDQTYDYNFNPQHFIKRNINYSITLGNNFISFPDSKNLLRIEDAFNEEDLYYIESILGEAEAIHVQGRDLIGNLEYFQPGKGYIIKGKNLTAAEPGVEPEKYNFRFFEDEGDLSDNGRESRGRYLIVVSEDTDLMSYHGHFPYMANRDWGEPFHGGADPVQLMKRFSSSIFFGYGGSPMWEDSETWPYSTKTHEEMSTPNTLVRTQEYWEEKHNNYTEPLIDHNFIKYLKSRGFIVDIAVLNRKLRLATSGPNAGELMYTGAHPEDIPDLSEVHPLVTEDWSQLRELYPEYGAGGMWQFWGQGNIGDKGGVWSPWCLNAHIQWYRNKYENTDAPLKNILFWGQPCAGGGAGITGSTSPTSCIPFFYIHSYTFSMNNASDWPYQMYTTEFVQSYLKMTYGEDGPADGGWWAEGLWDSYMNWDSYDDVIAICNHPKIAANELNQNDFSGYFSRHMQASDPNGDWPIEYFKGMKHLYEPSYHVSRMNTKAPSNAYTIRPQEMALMLQNTIGYHNFQHLFIANSDRCVSPEGGIPAYGTCNESGVECMIEGEDAIYAGCGSSGGCQWFSDECTNFENREWYKEYLSNSLHIGVNFAG